MRVFLYTIATIVVFYATTQMVLARECVTPQNLVHEVGMDLTDPGEFDIYRMTHIRQLAEHPDYQATYDGQPLYRYGYDPSVPRNRNLIYVDDDADTTDYIDRIEAYIEAQRPDPT